VEKLLEEIAKYQTTLIVVGRELGYKNALLKRCRVISTEAPISAFARCPALRRKTQGQAESKGGEVEKTV